MIEFPDANLKLDRVQVSFIKYPTVETSRHRTFTDLEFSFLVVGDVVRRSESDV